MVPGKPSFFAESGTSCERRGPCLIQNNLLKIFTWFITDEIAMSKISCGGFYLYTFRYDEPRRPRRGAPAVDQRPHEKNAKNFWPRRAPEKP
jgi:hypothetical protein